MAGVPAGSPAPLTVEPVPVTGRITIDGAVPTQEEAADFGTYSTIVFAGTAADTPQRLVQQSNDAVRAWVLVTGTGPVYVCSEAQANAIKSGQSVGPASGFVLPVGILFPIGHKEIVWVMSDQVHAANVSVAIERRRAA